jgi:hypothetical protein
MSETTLKGQRLIFKTNDGLIHAQELREVHPNTF